MESFQTWIAQAWKNGVYPTRPDVRLVQAASGGRTLKHLSSPTSTIWTGMSLKIAATTNSTVGANDCAVPWIFAMLANTHSEGPMTDAQFDAFVTNARAAQPFAKGLVVLTMNPVFCESPCLVTRTEIEAQAAFLRTKAGVRPDGFPIDVLDMQQIPGWSPSLMMSDLVHENLTGAAFGGTWMLDQWKNDPLGVYWFLFPGAQPPTVGPPPPPPVPTYGPLEGALLKLLNGTCSVVWGSLEAPLPASWCSGL